MTPKSTVLAAAIVAAALTVPAGLAQAAPIAPVQSAAGQTDVTPVYYRHGYRGHYYRHPYRYHRRYGYHWRQPYLYGAYGAYGAYAYQPESLDQTYSYVPNASTCPYYGSNNLWWCH